ncbi:MAG: hypothetical protein AAB393_11475, partial [Bacteroidota bacterium]
MLPDYDLVVIYDFPGVKRWELSSASPKLFHAQWLDHLAGEGKRSWETLMTRLASWGISRVNVWGPALVRDEAVEYADYIKEFLTSGHMVLDVAWPTPKPVWNNLPAFVRDEDDQMIEILRDFLISDGPDLAAETQQVVEAYRTNVLLFGLRGGPISEQQLFQAIADRFERRIATPVFGSSPEVRETFVKRFRAVTNRALQEGLVSRTVEGALTLTAFGRAYLAQVLEWRDTLLVRGYVTAADVLDVEQLKDQARQQVALAGVLASPAAGRADSNNASRTTSSPVSSQGSNRSRYVLRAITFISISIGLIFTGFAFYGSFITGWATLLVGALI